MCDSPDLVFSQYGQGFPTPSLSWHVPEQRQLSEQQRLSNKKPRAKRDCQKRKLPPCQSYVINNEKRKGQRLIQIQVLDISEQQESASDNEDAVVMSAQYIVSEPVDYVMEETLSLINKISKKLCGDNCY